LVSKDFQKQHDLFREYTDSNKKAVVFKHIKLKSVWVLLKVRWSSKQVGSLNCQNATTATYW